MESRSSSSSRRAGAHRRAYAALGASGVPGSRGPMSAAAAVGTAGGVLVPFLLFVLANDLGRHAVVHVGQLGHVELGVGRAFVRRRICGRNDAVWKDVAAFSGLFIGQ